MGSMTPYIQQPAKVARAVPLDAPDSTLSPGFSTQHLLSLWSVNLRKEQFANHGSKLCYTWTTKTVRDEEQVFKKYQKTM